MKKITVTALIGAIIIALVVVAGFYFFNIGEDTVQVHLADANNSENVGSGQPQTDESAELRLVPVDASTVQTVIGTIVRPDSYYRALETELFWEGGSCVYSIKVWAENDRVRVLSQSENTEKNILIADGMLYLWYNDSDSIFEGKTEEMLPRLGDEYQMLSYYEDLLKLQVSEIKDAAYAEYEGEYCIFAETKLGELGYTQRYYISIENGLLDGMEIFDSEKLIFRMKTVGETERGDQPDEIFIIRP